MKRTFMVCYQSQDPWRGIEHGRAFVTLEGPRIKLNKGNVELMEEMVKQDNPLLAGASLFFTNIIEMES
jgi:hypothetical protein